MPDWEFPPPPAPLPAKIARDKSGYAPRRAEKPKIRRLRIFGLDPSLTKRLDSLSVSHTTIDVPFECDSHGIPTLKPGPVGEYIEVVDVDPASNRIYHPVDLNSVSLLLSDGLTPSEGDPQFHQQMVYAVVMNTIMTFEKALGRRVLWSIRRGHVNGKAVFERVDRLRIYPHAIRERNAYYSPDRVAILFGYFPAESNRLDAVVNGTMVFSCLSADIITHETAHALLDGVYHLYLEDSNADVRAFHEAFADIVAILQHFQYREIVVAEIERTRGNVSMSTLLAGLAQEFGEASGRGGHLRDYIDARTGEIDYNTNFDSHDRGSLLVFSIYQAFIHLVERRVDGVITLATGGTGKLPEGKIHPTVVSAIADATCRVGATLLSIFIRALDYCPVVDITFADYLRAVITCDTDAAPVDAHGYRTAIMQAFSGTGLLPELKIISVRSLAWQPPLEARPAWLAPMMQKLAFDWSINRSERITDHHTREMRRRVVHQILTDHFGREPEAMREFGLQPGLPIYDDDGALNNTPNIPLSVWSVHSVKRPRPDGEMTQLVVVTLSQRRREPLFEDDIGDSAKWFWFHGGCTIVIDPRPDHGSQASPTIQYVVAKDIMSTARLARSRSYRQSKVNSTRDQYFDTHAMAASEPFAMAHSRHTL